MSAPTTAYPKHMKLGFSLLENGSSFSAPRGGLQEIASLFPGAFGIWLTAPFLVIQVKEIPKKPPFTVAGLPVRFTTDERGRCFDFGVCGKGAGILKEIDVTPRGKDGFSASVLEKVVQALSALKPRAVMWLGCCWQIELEQGTDIKDAPVWMCHSGPFYRFASDAAELDTTTLRAVVPGAGLTGVHIKGLDFLDSTHVGREIMMDSAPTGRLTGQIISIGAYRHGNRYIKQICFVLENGAELTPASYGAAILDQDGKVLGFLRLLSRDSPPLAYAVDAMEMDAADLGLWQGDQNHLKARL